MEKNEPNQNKYDAALAKYNTQLDDTEVAAQVAKIIAEKVPGNHTEEVKKFLFHCIDLTTLNTTDSDESVMKFTQKVNQFDEEFPDLENVAAICVYPNFAEIVKSTLEVEDVKIACVSAGFPSSQTFTEVKVAETAMALMEGADEIDIVISVGKFLSGDYENMCEEIQELKDVCKEHHMKVILETGALKSASNIMKASILSMYSGADFIKTSTGKQQPAATPEGADEIDIVISVGKFLSGDYENMCEEIQELKDVCKEHHMKVILETGALKSASNIMKASILSMYSGADFIKTSTGKQQPAATPEAAYVMCRAIKEYYDKTGNKVGFKPAGGINTVNDAVIYYTIVKEVLGEEWLNNQWFRLGTSRLANLLLSDIKGMEMKFF